MKFKNYSLNYPKDILVKVFFNPVGQIYNLYFINNEGIYKKLILKNIFVIEQCKLNRVLTFKKNLNYSNLKTLKTLWRTYRVLLTNGIKDLRYGFLVNLELRGVGFKFEIQNNLLILNLGFSHVIRYKIPEGVQITPYNKGTSAFTVSGNDRCLVKEVVSVIRNFKFPEPYKGKGVCFQGEIIKLKESKKEQ